VFQDNWPGFQAFRKKDVGFRQGSLNSAEMDEPSTSNPNSALVVAVEQRELGMLVVAGA